MSERAEPTPGTPPKCGSPGDETEATREIHAEATFVAAVEQALANGRDAEAMLRSMARLCDAQAAVIAHYERGPRIVLPVRGPIS